MVLLVAGGLLAASWRRLENADVGFDRSHLLTFLVRPSEVRYPAPKAPALIARVLAEIEAAARRRGGDGRRMRAGRNRLREHHAVHRRTPGSRARRTRPACSPLRGPESLSHARRSAAARPRVRRPRSSRRASRRDHQRTGGAALLAERRSDRQTRVVRRRQHVRPPGLERRDRRNRRRRRVSVARRASVSAGLLYTVRAVHVRDAHRARANAARPDRRRRRHSPRRVAASIQTSRCSTFARWTTSSAIHGRASAIRRRFSRRSPSIALLLAATGIFAIVAHVINDRRREIGVRVALGASPVAGARRRSVRPASSPRSFGLIGGAIATVFLARALAAVVYGVRAFDPA